MVTNNYILQLKIFYLWLHTTIYYDIITAYNRRKLWNKILL